MTRTTCARRGRARSRRSRRAVAMTAPPAAGATAAAALGCASMFDGVNAAHVSTVAAPRGRRRPPERAHAVDPHATVPAAQQGKGGKNVPRPSSRSGFHVVTDGSTGAGHERGRSPQQITVPERSLTAGSTAAPPRRLPASGSPVSRAPTTRRGSTRGSASNGRARVRRRRSAAAAAGRSTSTPRTARRRGPRLGVPTQATAEALRPSTAIVLDWNTLPGGPTRACSTLGHTATHEVGHWLSLAHPFDFGLQPQLRRLRAGHARRSRARRSGARSARTAVSRTRGSDPIHNYMDYSDDPCYSEFTAGQTKRMEQRFRHYRA